MGPDTDFPQDRAAKPLRIFLSYGHDEHRLVAERIKADLEARGHDVWYDAERLTAGRDWERYVEEGLRGCDKVVLLMTPHSVRRRAASGSSDGFCLNEIAKALERNKTIIPVLVVELADGPPLSICRIQRLDLRDAIPIEENEACYAKRFERLLRAVEEDELDFEGGQARLLRHLRPLDFGDDIRRHVAAFTGRGWLFEELDGWLAGDEGSRVFWLTGLPGVGKTAITAQLAHTWHGVVACHFCAHNHAEKRDPARAVMSVSYQMAQAMPEYDRRLQALAIEEEVHADAQTLFDALIVQPLGGNFPAPDGPRLVVVDALDEATVGGRNGIAELVRDQWPRTPPWLRLFVTSRPEAEVMATLGGLRPHVFDAGRAENLEDLRSYLYGELVGLGFAPEARAVEAVVERSEGVFLYVKVFLEELSAGNVSLDDPGSFPAGLAGLYHSFFQRRFPDAAAYERDVMPLLGVISGQRGPLPLGLLASATGLTEAPLRRRLAKVGSLFPVARSTHPGGGETARTIAPCHKSVRDWLTAEDETTGLAKAGDFAVDAAEGEARLAEACWQESRTGVSEGRAPSPYALRHLPAHLAAAGRWGDLVTLLTDFEFVCAKTSALGPQAVIEDYAPALDAAAAVPAQSRRGLGLIRDAIRLSAHVVAGDPSQLAGQLLGRMGAFDEPPVRKLLDEAARWRGAPWLRPLRATLRPPGGPLIRTLTGHSGEISAVALTPDARVVSGSWDETLKVWNLKTGECERTLQRHMGWVEAVAVTPDGRVVSASQYGTLKIWRLDTGQCVRTLKRRYLPLVALTPDGQCMLVRFCDDLMVCSLETGEQERRLKGHSAPVDSVAVTADGRAVSGSQDRTLKVWDLETGECERTLEGHSDSVISVTLTPDGHAVSGSMDRTLRVWSLETGQCVRTLTGHSSLVSAVAMTPHGRVVSGSGDRTLKVWNVETGECERTLEGHSAAVTAVAVTPNGLAVSGSSDGTLKVWDLRGGECEATSEGHSDSVSGVAVTQEGRAVTASRDGTLKVWDVETGECKRTLEGHSGRVETVAVMPDGRAVSGSNDCTLKVWNLETGECERTLVARSGFVGAVAVTPDGRVVSVSGYDTLEAWDPRTGRRERTLETTYYLTNAVAVTADERAVLGSEAGTLEVWSLGTGECQLTLEGHSPLFHGFVCGVALTPEGRAVSGSKDGTLKVWDLETGECVRTLEGRSGSVRAVAVTADGLAAAGLGKNTLKVWRLRSGEALAGFTAEAAVQCCAVAPNGRTIVAGDASGRVHFLRLEGVDD